MKIAFFVEELSEHSGWGRYSIDLIRTLQEQGSEVFVFCYKRNQSMPIRQIEVLPSPLAFKRIAFQILFKRTLFKRVLKESSFAPDLVHCAVEPYAPLASVLARRLGVPLFITAHGSFAVRAFASRIQGYLQARAYRSARTIICISAYTQKRLHSFMPTARTIVIPNGVQLPTEAGAHAPAGPTILGVGALKERKGFLHVLQALPSVIQEFPDVSYTIVGNQNDTAYMCQLREAIAALHLEQHVEFKQKISDEQLDDLYRKARAFVLTPISSPFSFEGFGLVYLEANARGVPVVGSYGNGGEDAIKNGETGFLAAPADPGDIAEKIIALLGMPADRYTAMSDTCRAWAQSHSWEIIARRYADVYRTATV